MSDKKPERTTIIVQMPHGRETHYADVGDTVTHCGRGLNADVLHFEVSRNGKATCKHCSAPGSIAGLVVGKFRRLPESQRFGGRA